MALLAGGHEIYLGVKWSDISKWLLSKCCVIVSLRHTNIVIVSLVNIYQGHQIDSRLS